MKLFLPLIISVSICIEGNCTTFTSLEDSSKTSKEFSLRPNLMVNFFTTRQSKDRNIRNNEYSYNFREITLMGYYPVFEKNFPKKCNAERCDSDFNKNFSLLATGSLSSSKIDFSLYDNIKPVIRLSLGARAIYFDGNKSIFMANFAPFFSESAQSFGNMVPRFFASALYSRAVSEYFSYRLGFTFTYLLNGGTFLPLVGFRIGSYNSVYFNFQIPRDISLNFKISNKVWGGLFTRLSGGIYRFGMDDNKINFLQNNQVNNIALYRQELLTGIMINVAANSNLYFSFNAGFATQRKISGAFSNELIPTKKHFFADVTLKNSLFINVSVSYFFGKPIYNAGYNYLIEQKAINNSIDAGDINTGSNQTTNDMNAVKMRDITKKDIKKLNSNYLDLKDVLLEE
jgi:hypothetical protein